MKLFEEYLTYYDKYVKIYDKLVILMQVGSFFEIYNIDNKGPNIKDLSILLNLHISRMNPKHCMNSNTCFIGFPTVCIDKYCDKLLDNGYTVIVMEQLTPPPNLTRGVTHIYFPETCDNITNNELDVFQEEIITITI